MHFSAKTPFYLHQSSPYGETHKNSLRFNLHYSSICTLKYISTQCIYSADSTAILKYMYAPTSLALSSKEMPPKKMEMGSLSFIYTYITLCTVQCRQYNKYIQYMVLYAPKPLAVSSNKRPPQKMCHLFHANVCNSAYCLSPWIPICNPVSRAVNPT